MEELLSIYTVEEILLMLFLLGTALFSIFKFIDYVCEKSDLHISRKVREEQANRIRTETAKKVDWLEEQMRILLESDKSRIRGEIVREHHKFMSQGWIDLYSMDYLIQQFNCYENEGGNSYIHDLIKDLQALPNEELGKS